MIAVQRLLNTALAIGFMTASPAILVADEIDDAAIDGAGFATTVFPDAVVDQNGNVSIGGQQEELTPEELFPGADDGEALRSLTSIRKTRPRPPASERAAKAAMPSTSSTTPMRSSATISRKIRFSTPPIEPSAMSMRLARSSAPARRRARS